MEEVNLYIDEAKDKMKKAIEHTADQFKKIRAGKASPGMLEGIRVDYYGTPTPLSQIAAINTPDAKSLVIKPFEKNLIGEIEKAIVNSHLGLNPGNEGDIIRIVVPPLTEERRRDLMKQVKTEAENGKIAIRNIRQDANNGIKKLKDESVAEDDIKKGEQEVQTLTNTYTAKVDDIYKQKEEEVMTV